MFACGAPKRVGVYCSALVHNEGEYCPRHKLIAEARPSADKLLREVLDGSFSIPTGAQEREKWEDWAARVRFHFVSQETTADDLDHCGGCGGPCVTWQEDRPLYASDPCAWIREPGLWVFDCATAGERDEAPQAG